MEAVGRGEGSKAPYASLSHTWTSFVTMVATTLSQLLWVMVVMQKQKVNKWHHVYVCLPPPLNPSLVTQQYRELTEGRSCGVSVLSCDDEEQI